MPRGQPPTPRLLRKRSRAGRRAKEGRRPATAGKLRSAGGCGIRIANFEWRLCRRLKPDFPSRRIRWGRRRVQDLHEILKDVDDGCFVRVEPAGELFLQCFELFRQLARAKQRLAHFYESTDHKHVDSRSPDRSVASPCDQCSPSNGVPARRIHLNCPLAVQDTCSHQSAVFGESVGM